MLIRWTVAALRDLEQLRDAEAVRSPAVAALVLKRLVDAVALLSEFPDAGQLLPEREDLQLRELLRDPWRIIYEREGRYIYVLAVLRAGRGVPDALR